MKMKLLLFIVVLFCACTQKPERNFKIEITSAYGIKDTIDVMATRIYLYQMQPGTLWADGKNWQPKLIANYVMKFKILNP